MELIAIIILPRYFRTHEEFILLSNTKKKSGSEGMIISQTKLTIAKSFFNEAIILFNVDSFANKDKKIMTFLYSC